MYYIKDNSVLFITPKYPYEHEPKMRGWRIVLVWLGCGAFCSGAWLGVYKLGELAISKLR